jgi:hypothetical protein
VLVDRLPAVPLDDGGGAGAQPRAGGLAVGVGQLRQPPGAGVLDDLGDGVGGVLLVRADHAARAALDPADAVLARLRLPVLAAHAAAVVADQAAPEVERDVGERRAAVADRADDEPAGDDLLAVARHRP